MTFVRLTLSLLFVLNSSACTKVTLDLGHDGDSCQATYQCENGLLCSEEVCVSATVEADVVADTALEQDAQRTATVDADGVVQAHSDVALDIGTGPNDVTVSVDILSDVAQGVVDVLSDTEVETGDGAGDFSDLGTVDSMSDLPLTTDSTSVDNSDDTMDSFSTLEDVSDDDVEDVVGPPGLGEPCQGVCQIGLYCVPNLEGGAECNYLPQGLCHPCVSASDCLAEGAECIQLSSTEKVCGAPCGLSSDCLTGFFCYDAQCIPENATCECTPEKVGKAHLGCMNQSSNGVCYGKVTCQIGGWSNCSALPPTDESCDNLDNDCDGYIDETLSYIENGASLQLGFPCGLGQCVGGEVVCEGNGVIGCSSNGLAMPEACADNVDNDCDGFLNENCESTDYDGDGVPNDVDCDPIDAAFYQGAAEGCCDPALGYVYECDTNCDGEITPCEACDTDLDGFCPPDDCNEGEPLIYPAAPDLCNDGIDQDCQGGDLLCSLTQDADKDGWIPPADCNEGNPAIYPNAPELCDNHDNDCDGIIDEGNPQAGQECHTGPEYCVSGLMICSHYQFGAAIQCQGSVLSELERCDGLDNDCNGQTDETFTDLGQICDGLDIDECTNGVIVCLGDGSGTVCSEEDPENIYEECNQVDDDCDDAIDEFVCPITDLDGDGFTVEDGDCDDWKSEKFPFVQSLEPCCDPSLGVLGQTVCDLNCDGLIVPCGLDDLDSDGYGPADGDCDEDDPKIHPGAAELCGDGIDQDCQDGDILCETVNDNDLDGFHVGVDCNDFNSQVHPWANEICNFIDDDCDSMIDEGNPTGLIGPCGPDVSECDEGEWVCVHDTNTSTVQTVCVTSSFQNPEFCNGLDDDCDGNLDETFHTLGLPCDGPDNDQCEGGAYLCAEDGESTVCVEEEVNTTVEICDVIDNDCDGLIDEALSWADTSLGELCDGTGECGTGVVMCSSYFYPTCSTNPDGAFPQTDVEQCNGLDDDCDGGTDEGFVYMGTIAGGPCDGVGTCGAGVVECTSLTTVTCSTNPDGTAPQVIPEQCDGVDNDCDGHADNGLLSESSSCPVVGVCEAGEVNASCVFAEWVCDMSGIENWEAEEISCDALDNDCDGNTDEGFALGETCDGADDDVCANGMLICNNTGDGVTCGPESPQGIIEACNQVDDDCDGITDELDGNPADFGCLVVGVCAKTENIIVTCEGSDSLCNYEQVEDWEGAEELTCDDLDNNCDGHTDEGLTYQGLLKGEACDGLGGCGVGVVQCDAINQVPMCSTEPSGEDDESESETCDTVDNDCDGLTDEDFPWEGLLPGQACLGIGACELGTVECVEDGAPSRCSSMPDGSDAQNTPETCNAVDDDCDGFTDETDELDSAQADCLDQGVCLSSDLPITCEGGEWICHYSSIPNYEYVEVSCDDLDNDCNGLVDEAHPLKDHPCDGDDDNDCASGYWKCTADQSAIECLGEEDGGAIAEVCDGMDNDCDGAADNGMNYDGIPLDSLCVGRGECGVGTVVCDAELEATCSTNPSGNASQAQPETCDDKDDDCDGNTDEDFQWQGLNIDEVCDGVGLCGIGSVECSPGSGVATCSSNPDGSSSGVIEEGCTGFDEDCDGLTDESFSTKGSACDGEDADDCMTGVWACQGGEEACSQDSVCPTDAICSTTNDGESQACVCSNGQACHSAIGDACGENGCTCAGGPPCADGQTCNPEVGCE